MYIIYHNRDFDGFASGAICKRKYPYATLIGYDYGQPTAEIDAIPDGEEIIMVDVSLPLKDMEALAQRSAWLKHIDHHISFIKEYEAYPSKFMQAIHEVGKAACELTWNHLYPNSRRPFGISLLGNYDVWRNQDKDLWNNYIMPFQMGMKLTCNTVETFPAVIFGKQEDDYPSEEAVAFVEAVLENGKIVLAYQKLANETACKNAFPAEIEGLKAICLNIGEGSSTIFESVWDETKYDVMMPFVWTGKFWRCSLYTTKTDIDCSAVAKKLGGGGHKQAAGFQTDDVFRLLRI